MNTYHAEYDTDAEAIEAVRELNAKGVKCNVSRGYTTEKAILVIYADESPIEGAKLVHTEEEDEDASE